MKMFAVDAGNFGAPARHPYRVVVDLCLSLLLHGLFIFGYRSGSAPPARIDDGKRADCKEGIPGGLLAPLYLLLKKKDSGCEW